MAGQVQWSVVGLALVVVAAGGCDDQAIAPSPNDQDGADVGWMPGEYLVELREAPGARFRSRLRASGREFLGAPRVRGRRWARVRVPGGQDPTEVGPRLQRELGAIAVQPNYRYTPDVIPDDPDFAQQYAHEITGAREGWELETGSRDVVVAVIGSGVERTHPDLAANMWSNPNEIADNGVDDDGNGFIDDVVGWDFFDDDNDPTPTFDHETSVAGVIGAVPNNGEGIAGVVWDAAIMDLRIEYSSEDAAAAIYYAVDQGASVINMSFGSAGPTKYGPDSIVEQALAYAEEHGVVAVASAGNDDREILKYPAAVENVISVGATDPDDQRASFSTFGAWITVSAPGSRILSTRGLDYGLVNGTSFSAPYVAGVVALVRARHPEWTPAEIRQVIEYSGDRIGTDEPIGATRIQVRSALEAQGLPDSFARITEPRRGYPLARNELLTVVGTAIGSSYRLEVRRRGIEDWTLIATGGETLDGVLGVMELGGFDPGLHEVRVVAVGEQGSSEARSWFVIDVFTPGWPVAQDHGLWTVPTIGDLDGDGDYEVVLGANAGAMYVVHHDGEPMIGWPRFMSGQARSTALGDIDGDGDVEVVASTIYGQIMAWHHDGSDVSGWPIVVGGTNLDGPMLADVDQNGVLDIVVRYGESNQPTTLDVRDGNAASLSGWPAYLPVNVPRYPIVADFDGDGRPEVAAVGDEVYLLEADGEVAAGWPQPGEYKWGRHAAADLDGNGAAELVLVGDAAAVVLQGDGSAFPGWPIQTGGNFRYQHASVGDLDGDGLAEVALVAFVSAYNYRLEVRRPNGSLVRGWPQAMQDTVISAPAIGDVDGDGSPDLVVNDRLEVHGFSSAGDPLLGFPKQLRTFSYAASQIADVAGDGNVQLLALGDLPRKAFLWDLGESYDPFVQPWPRYRRDVRNSAYAPRIFGLVAGGSEEGVWLNWDAPEDTPLPSYYEIVRDGNPIGRTQSTEFATSASGEARYGVVAYDEVGTVLTTSIQVMASEESTLSSCEGAGDGTFCDDENNCTEADRCVDELCVGMEITCPEVDMCKVNACDPATGRCKERRAEDGIACDDGDICTRAGQCFAGLCESQPIVCAIAHPCVVGSCDPDTGGCRFDPLPDGTACPHVEGDGMCVDSQCTVERASGGCSIAPGSERGLPIWDWLVILGLGCRWLRRGSQGSHAMR